MPLLPTRGNDRESALDEAAPGLACGPLRYLALDDRRSQRLLGRVVDAQHVGFLDEDEQGREQAQQAPTQPVDLVVSAFQAGLQASSPATLEALDGRAGLVKPDLACFAPVVELEKLLLELAKVQAVPARLRPQGFERLEVPLQVRMANLPVLHRVVLVCRQAVADQRPAEASEQEVLAGARAAVQLEDDGAGAHDDPQPGLAGFLVAPTRLVH